LFAGAVVYGAVPKLITARRCRLWYGLRTTRDFNSVRHEGIQPDWDEELGAHCIKDSFSQLVARGKLLRVDESVESSGFLPVYETQEKLGMVLYGTTDPSPRANGVRLTTDAGMLQIASLEVDISELHSEGVPLGDRKVSVQLQFGKTELLMMARVEKTGRELKTNVVYS
jgi:hypothetical protein